MDVPGVALITGAGSGIGRACARMFALESCSGLALLDISQDGLDQTRTEIQNVLKERGDGKPLPQINLYTLDISNEEKVNDTVADAAHSFGRIDYAVNAAGIALKHQGGVGFAETNDWQRTIDINLTGTFYVVRAVARIMLKQDPIISTIDGRPLQRGSIVNFSSIQGLVGITLSAAYTASKHAIIGLTKSASEDYAKDGLRINAICPGYTETPMTTKSAPVLKAMQERVSTAVPMGRMGQPNEIADGVVWLAGGRSSFVTGISLSVDGGYIQR